MPSSSPPKDSTEQLTLFDNIQHRMTKEKVQNAVEEIRDCFGKSAITKGVFYKILRDERYLGTAVYGKRERDMVGLVHSVKKTRADWITVEAAHEGIIEPELFQAAAAGASFAEPLRAAD